MSCDPTHLQDDNEICWQELLSTIKSKSASVIGEQQVPFRLLMYVADGLVEIMIRIRTDENYRAQVATTGLKHSQHFSWQKCAQQMYSAYETAYQQLRAS